MGQDNVTIGKRVAFVEKGLVKVEEFQVNEPGAKEVLIKSTSTLICSGTEGAFLMAMPNTSNSFPQYPGYSNAGIIEAVGSDVVDRSCGEKVVSWTNHASHVLEDAANILPFPDNLSFDDATFFALASIALNGVRKATIELGESVAVMGQGLVGQLALQLARLSGAVPLIAIDLLNARLGASMKSGADLTINPGEKDLNGEIKRLTGGKGVNVVIEATGNPDAIPVACKLVRPYGRVILLGSPRGETKINFYSEVHAKSVTMIGSYMRPSYESYHSSWTDKDDAKLILKLLDQGRLKVRHLVTRKMPYYEATEAYLQVINKSTLGIILDWQHHR